jgi:hypothetical protein
LSKYISRTVILDDGQDADDLRVYLSALIPTNSSISVFAKMSAANESEAFSDRPWTLLDENVVNGVGIYQEIYYTIPTGGTATENGGLTVGGVYTYTRDSKPQEGIKAFAIKIVFFSDDTTRVPKIRDLRTIALQA